MKVSKPADLKRLPQGTRLRCVATKFGPHSTDYVVSKISSTGIWMNRSDRPGDANRSWLPFPKASQFKAIDGGFEVTEDGVLAYRYLVEPPVATEEVILDHFQAMVNGTDTEDATGGATLPDDWTTFVKDHFSVVRVG